MRSTHLSSVDHFHQHEIPPCSSEWEKTLLTYFQSSSTFLISQWRDMIGMQSPSFKSRSHGASSQGRGPPAIRPQGLLAGGEEGVEVHSARHWYVLNSECCPLLIHLIEVQSPQRSPAILVNSGHSLRLQCANRLLQPRSTALFDRVSSKTTIQGCGVRATHTLTEDPGGARQVLNTVSLALVPRQNSSTEPLKFARQA